MTQTLDKPKTEEPFEVFGEYLSTMHKMLCEVQDNVRQLEGKVRELSRDMEARE